MLLLPAVLTGQVRTLGEQDFRMQNLPSKLYTEYWEYTCILNGSMLLTYTFSISDFGGFRDRSTGVRLVVLRDGLPAHVVNKEYHPEQMVHDPAQWLLRPHNERDYIARGKPDSAHSLLFRTAKKGHRYHVNLTFSSVTPGTANPKSILSVEGVDVHVLPLFAQADVSGFVVIDRDSIMVRGKGFLDHVFYQSIPQKLFKSGMSIKSVRNDGALSAMVLERVHPGATPVIVTGTRMVHGVAYPVEQTALAAYTTHPDHRPKNAALYGRFFQLEAARLSHTYALLAELGELKRAVARRAFGREVIEAYSLLPGSEGPTAVHSFWIK
jgi:hypothetical protein